MERREFLVGAAASAAAVAGFSRAGRAQTQRQVDQTKLGRVAIMTLCFNNILKLPGQAAGPDRTLEVFDIGQMYADMYGVHNVEMQHSHFISTEDSYLKELRARFDRTNTHITNINVEFGQMTCSAADPVLRAQALDLTNRWVDHAVVLGCPRVMINQGQLTHENKGDAIATLRKMGEYGKSKGIMISVETRGNGANTGGARGSVLTAAQAAPPPANPANPAAGGRGFAAAPPPLIVTPAWVLLSQVIKDSGTYANVDLGNVNAGDQGELHAALRTLLPMTVNNTHTRVNTLWDLATTVKFMTGNLRYSGLFSIETNGHDAVKQIYNIVLDSIVV